ncbi:MAG: RNA polymerase sigma factor [Planctomycetaceae bacterium]
MDFVPDFTHCSEWSEALLIERCLAGDSGAVREFVARFQGLILGVSQRILAHRQDAEDVAQETLVRALRSLSRFDQQRPLQPWILRIAVNRCRTALSLRRNRELGTELVHHVADRPPSSDQELAEELELALGHLREQYRISFVLYHHQQLSLPEIAQICNCPVGTVKTWLHRARRQLAVRLAERGLGPREFRPSQTVPSLRSVPESHSVSTVDLEESPPAQDAAKPTSGQLR